MKREANNHRPFEAYLHWFKDVLRINAPLIVYIPPQGEYSGGYDLRAFVQAHRNSSKYPTLIKIVPFKELPLYKEQKRISEVMTKLDHPDPRLEFHHPEYIITIYSKFHFLDEAIQENPFETRYFFWIDAGYFRSPPDESIEKPWPDPHKLRPLERGKILVQNYNLVPPKERSVLTLMASFEAREYLKGCSNEIIACFFGGLKESLRSFGQEVLSSLDWMLKDGLVNNEQQAMSLLIKAYPDKYLLYPGDDNYRRLVEDMAQGNHFKIGFTECPSLKAFTVVSKEIPDESFQGWVDSARYFGYPHEVLARNEKWGGWPFRTKQYLEALRKIEGSVEIAILSDGTDLLFCGPAWEAYDKFKKEEEPILIGGENIIAYSQSKGRHSSYEIEEFFMQRCHSRFCFPNGGFLIGRVPALIKLMEANLDSNDDQAGYMDLLYEKKFDYKIDEKTCYVGNLCNYGIYTERDVGFWKWDELKCRYYNPITKEYPIALHFPGGNRLHQTRIYRQVVPLQRKIEPKEESNWFFWFLLIVLLVFLVITFWLFRRWSW
jgi:hypothetical protein